MSIISWSDKFSIGVEKIDEQHKALFSLINNLHSVITGVHPKQSISSSINDLISYTEYHFKEEEDYMFNTDYPKFEQHKKVHDELREQVVNFKLEFDEGRGDAGKFVEFLYDWLTRHIMDQDKKIGKYMDMIILRPIMRD